MVTQTSHAIDVEKRQEIYWQKSYQALKVLHAKSLNDAAGMLKNKYKDLKKHYLKIRREWPSYGK